MWNLEKWYRWTYLQSRNRDTDVEDQLAGDGMNWGVGIDTDSTAYKIGNEWEPTVQRRELYSGLCMT